MDEPFVQDSDNVTFSQSQNHIMQGPSVHRKLSLTTRESCVIPITVADLHFSKSITTVLREKNLTLEGKLR